MTGMAPDSVDPKRLDGVLSAMGRVTAEALIPLLQKIQGAYGYLPREVILEASRRTGIPASRMFGVATFYEQFYLEPRGRHTIKCCRGTACHVRGGAEIAETLSRLLGVEHGGTTADRKFSFETVACLGTCFLAPVIMVNNDYYGNLNPKKLEAILKRYS
jgi:NADH-quinone oxidoreductase subunit E